ncbi:HAD family hydrolase [Sulfurospirillum sp. T05]|uniref:phosphoglycolate phosphatase n=1 Tax=Sulfurospirillum tamanense TaxID=2813362 RepID=A0ABS2WSL0_9BACT|nr:HAD family hydrolase [Sulfurospirillum tamanensis]MBN2964149.1 HAD family hydrolase [Sulfurospirillum tamanensis]
MKCIIFDMDGTLVDSSHGITCSINHVRRSIGLPFIETEQLVRFINDPDEHLPLRFYGTKEYDPGHKALFTEHYLEHCTQGLKLYKGVFETLDSLHGEAKLAVATNASDFFAQKMLSHCGIGHYFETIVGANTFGTSKPDPAMLFGLLESLHVSPSEAILVGDSLKDAYAAQNANMPFVYVTWGFGDYQTSTPHVAHSPDALASILKQLLSQRS